MKKEKFLISIVAIIVFLSVMRILGVYEIYTVDAPAMTPNYNSEEYMFGTNLKSPKRSDVVSYKSDTLVQILKRQRRRYGRESEFKDNSIFFSRIVGKGGDQIELKNGMIYLNGKKNEPFDFMLQHVMEVNTYNQLSKRILPQRELYGYNIRDSVVINLSQEELKTLQEFVEVKQYMRMRSNDIFGNENWTYGNYGPIEIPSQHFFLVSDNRFAAMDSRTHGFVHEDEIVNVILN